MGIRSTFLNHRPSVITKGLRRSERSAGCWMSRFKLVGGSPREIRGVIQLREAMRSPSGHKLALSILPRKTSKEFGR
jgi:hypothetical protein